MSDASKLSKDLESQRAALLSDLPLTALLCVCMAAKFDGTVDQDLGFSNILGMMLPERCQPKSGRSKYSMKKRSREEPPIPSKEFIESVQRKEFALFSIISANKLCASPLCDDVSFKFLELFVSAATKDIAMQKEIAELYCMSMHEPKAAEISPRLKAIACISLKMNAEVSETSVVISPGIRHISGLTGRETVLMKATSILKKFIQSPPKTALKNYRGKKVFVGSPPFKSPEGRVLRSQEAAPPPPRKRGFQG